MKIHSPRVRIYFISVSQKPSPPKFYHRIYMTYRNDNVDSETTEFQENHITEVANTHT